MERSTSICTTQCYALLTAFLMVTTVGVEAQETASVTDAASVESIKKGVLSMDRSVTVGQAFDRYQLFSAKIWTAKTAENGRQTVEAAGTIPFNKLTPADFTAAYARAGGVPIQTVANNRDVAAQTAAAIRNAQQKFRGAQLVLEF